MDVVPGKVRGAGAFLHTEDSPSSDAEDRHAEQVKKPGVQKLITHYGSKAVNATPTFKENHTKAIAQEETLCGRPFEAVEQHHLNSHEARRKKIVDQFKGKGTQNSDYRLRLQKMAMATLKGIVLEQLNGCVPTENHQELQKLINGYCNNICRLTIPKELNKGYQLVYPEVLWPIDKYKSADMIERQRAASHCEGHFGLACNYLEVLEKKKPVVEPDENTEKMMLACFLSARETVKGYSNLYYIAYLESHMRDIEDMLKGKEYSVFNLQMIIVVWYYALSQLFRKCFMHQLTGGGNQRVNRGSDTAHDESREGYQKKCIEMLEWSKNRNFHRLASIDALSTISVILTSMFANHRKNVKALIHTYSLAAIDKAKSEDNKRIAYTNYIISCDHLRDFLNFTKISDSAAKYTLYPLFVMIWHDLGLRKNGWDCDTRLNPEGAVEHLEWLYSNQEMLDRMKPEMEHNAEMLPCGLGRSTCLKSLGSPASIILYYYLNNQENEARKVAERLDFKRLRIFEALVKVAQKKYMEALELIESDESNSRQLKAFLAILYEKAGNEVVGGEKDSGSYLKKSLQHLKMVSGYRKELLKSVARIQEKMGLMRECLKSLVEYKKYLINNLGYLESNQEVVFVCSRIEMLNEHLEIESALHQNDGKEKQKTLSGRKKKRKSRRRKVQRLPVSEKKADKALSEVKVSEKANLPDGTGQEGVDSSVMTLPASGREEKIYFPDDEFIIPDFLLKDKVEDEIACTLKERLPLYNALKYGGRINYDDLIGKHNALLNKYNNPVSQILLLQNKVWTLRVKASDAYALALDAYQYGDPVSVRKIYLCREILDMLFKQVESVSHLWISELPEEWKTEPEKILESDNLQFMLANAAPRFAIQVGSLFSTIGHVMQEELAEDHPGNQKLEAYKESLFGIRKHEFSDLAGKYYTCSKQIKRYANSELQMQEQ